MKAGRQTKLLHSILKYGYEAHKVEILHQCLPVELNSWEKYFIDVYNTFNTDHGMNLKAGGHQGGTLSEESKAKLRKPKSDEAREKYRQVALNRPQISEETREKHRQNMKGNKNLLGIRAVSKTTYLKDKDGIVLEFMCLIDCAQSVGVHVDSIRKAIIKKQTCKGIAFSHRREDLDVMTPPIINASKRQSVHTKDIAGNIVKHESFRDCEKSIKISRAVIKNCALSGKQVKGYYFSRQPFEIGN